MLINPGSKIPKHVQTAILLKQRIGKGDYVPGMNMPPVRLLGAELGVSSNVIHRAVRILEKEGIVETQHGVGVRVLDTERKRRTPLRLGMVHPYTPDSLFAGTIHCLVDKALDLRKNHCVVKSSHHDAKRERDMVAEFIDTGVEGLLIWPCEGSENAEFFAKVFKKVPFVFIDRKIDPIMAPSVVLDYAALGRDIITYMGSKGYSKVLILEDPLSVSSYCEMYQTMREMVDTIDARGRFHFVKLNASTFVEKYPEDPDNMVKNYSGELDNILKTERYEAMFTVQDEFIDYAFINTPLAEKYPSLNLFGLSNTLPTPRSPGFYKRSVYEWIGDFGQVISKASEILHDMMYLRNHPMRQHRVKFTMVLRGMSK